MRRVSIVLIMCMFFGLLAAGSMAGRAQADTASPYQAGDIVTFGSYPQTRVTDATLVASLTSAVSNRFFTDYPYTSKNEKFDYVSGTSRMKRNYDMMSYCDFTYNGVKYRAVKIKQLRPDYAWGEPGSHDYMNINGYEEGNTYFFRWEPLQWYVVDPDNGILLSRYGIDGQAFCEMCKHGDRGAEYSCLNAAGYANDYAVATIREWLTVPSNAQAVYKDFNFLNKAFSSTEIAAMKTTTIKSYSTGMSYSDKIYLLSKEEFEAYKSVPGITDDIKSTDYAKSQGVGNTPYWTLRTPTTEDRTVLTSSILLAKGSGTSSFNADYASMYSTLSNIRPAVKVDISSSTIKKLTLNKPSVGYRFDWSTKEWVIVWNRVEGAEAYDVYWTTSTSDSWSKLTTIEGDPEKQSYSFRYSVSRILNRNITHQICVCAVASGGLSSERSSVISMYRIARLLFDLNGGTSGAPSDVISDEGRDYCFSATPVRDGYTFLGWAESKTATTPTYKNGDHISLVGDKTLYAVWKAEGPKITTWPKDTTVTVGSTATFTTGATGTGTLKYQWQYRKNASSEWKPSGQSGNKTATLSVATTVGLHGYQFRCIVKDSYGNQAISHVATLSLKPKITKQPEDTTVAVGNKAVFTVEATGKATLTYQWQYRKNVDDTWKNSGQSGNKTNTLSVATTTGLHGYQFRCVVTDGNKQKSYSKTVTLKVRPKITTWPKDTTAAPGTTAKFTVAATGKGTLKYQWQYRKNETGEWKDSGQSGNKTATLSVAVTAGLNGYQFRCYVTDANGQKSYTNTVTLTVSPRITTQPVNKTVTAGTAAKFTVVAAGKATLTYQWQYRRNSSDTWKNSGQSGNKTATLSVATTKGLNGYQFRCIVKDGDGRQTISGTVTLTVK